MQATNQMGQAQNENTLARNNSTHCKVSSGGKFGNPLGSSPLTKTGNYHSGGSNL